ELNRDQLEQILEDWKKNVLKLNNMILKDAEKEFDPTSRIGYGLDGDESVQQKDFESVRGTYDGNKFVKALCSENDEVEKRFQEMIKIL
ncbi:TPA: hypothetical protein DCG86_09260, partial [Candidatus Marinimicrobia bacterium]|nr:hypothetical protein [Candidatus Neomarinimicrobiota bacterium]